MNSKVNFISNNKQIKDFGVNSQISLGDLGPLFVKNNLNLVKNNTSGYLTPDIEKSNNLKSFIEKKSLQDFDKGAEDLRLAVRYLGMIVGKVDVEEVLGSIFNDFCIGK